MRRVNTVKLSILLYVDIFTFWSFECFVMWKCWHCRMCTYSTDTIFSHAFLHMNNFSCEIHAMCFAKYVHVNFKWMTWTSFEIFTWKLCEDICSVYNTISIVFVLIHVEMFILRRVNRKLTKQFPQLQNLLQYTYIREDHLRFEVHGDFRVAVPLSGVTRRQLFLTLRE